MTFSYHPNFIDLPTAEFLRWADSVSWLDRTTARREFSMTPVAGASYTYGGGTGARTYFSTECDSFGPMNGCFGNRYDDQHKALGWHSDDFVGMDHEKAVCVVSFGSAPLIYLLEHGSLLVMPPGAQHTHDHKVAKGDRPHDLPRVSATFRASL